MMKRRRGRWSQTCARGCCGGVCCVWTDSQEWRAKGLRTEREGRGGTGVRVESRGASSRADRLSFLSSLSFACLLSSCALRERRSRSAIRLAPTILISQRDDDGQHSREDTNGGRNTRAPSTLPCSLLPPFLHGDSFFVRPSQSVACYGRPFPPLHPQADADVRLPQSSSQCRPHQTAVQPLKKR